MDEPFPGAMHSLEYVWYWHPKPWRPIPRKGQRCRVLVRSRRMGSVLVEFADGFRVITSRHAVRRIGVSPTPAA